MNLVKKYYESQKQILPKLRDANEKRYRGKW